jgi:hypothetical protein
MRNYWLVAMFSKDMMASLFTSLVTWRQMISFFWEQIFAYPYPLLGVDEVCGEQ